MIWTKKSIRYSRPACVRLLCASVGLLAAMAAAAPGDEHTFELQWQKDCFRWTDQVTFDRQEPFASEPNVAGQDVDRAVLKIGPENAKEEIALLWDDFEGKLYVDLNRDGKLNSDPNELFTAQERSYLQRFTGVEVSFENDSGVYRYQLEFELYKDSRYSWVHVLSGYSGVCELNGRKWTIQANDALNARVAQGDLFSVFSDTFKNRISSGSIPQSIFLDGRLYDISFVFKKAEDGFAALSCTLNERQVPLGTLQVEGRWIDQLVLGDHTVWILPELTDQPIMVPAGNLEVKQFALKYAEDKPSITIDRLIRSVNVPEGSASELTIGGPLKSSVSISRQGTVLYFSYGLVGAGGENYNVGQITGYDRSKPPTVTVYKGDMQLASGKFEYG